MPRFIDNSTLSNNASQRIAERKAHDWEFKIDCLLLELSEEVSKQLIAKDMSQSDLATLLGTSRAYISQILHGKPNFSLKTLFKICHCIGIDVNIDFSSPSLSELYGKQTTRMTEIFIINKEFKSTRAEEYVQG